MPNKFSLRSTLSLFLLVSMGGLSACQNTPITAPIHPQQVIVMPNVIVQVDSDGDGVTDNLDQCSNTPEKVAIDEAGCPVSISLIGLLTMEFRAFFNDQGFKLQSSEAVYNELNKISIKMAEFPESTISVLGNMSVLEALNNSNSQLAKKRAQLVKEMLIANGVPASRIETFDCADHQQIAPNDTDEATAFNRRVYARMTIGKVYLDELENNICTEF